MEKFDPNLSCEQILVKRCKYRVAGARLHPPQRCVAIAESDLGCASQRRASGKLGRFRAIHIAILEREGEIIDCLHRAGSEGVVRGAVRPQPIPEVQFIESGKAGFAMWQDIFEVAGETGKRKRDKNIEAVGFRALVPDWVCQPLLKTKTKPL